MKIVDIMSEDLVVEDLRSRTRDEVLAELVERIAEQAASVDRTHAQRVLIERERIGSTGVARGIAIPHARVPNLERPIACFGRSQEGVDFGALDKQPTHFFLTLLTPEGSAGFHLKALARASRLFKDNDFLEALRVAPGRAQLWTAICVKDQTLSK